MEVESSVVLADGDIITVVERTFRYECKPFESAIAAPVNSAPVSAAETPRKLAAPSSLSQNVFSVSELASSPHTPQNPSLARITSTEQTPTGSPQRVPPSPLGSAIVDSEISTSPKLSPRVRMAAEEIETAREPSLLATECVTTADLENPFISEVKEIESGEATLEVSVEEPVEDPVEEQVEVELVEAVSMEAENVEIVTIEANPVEAELVEPVTEAESVMEAVSVEAESVEPVMGAENVEIVSNEHVLQAENIENAEQVKEVEESEQFEKVLEPEQFEEIKEVEAIHVDSMQVKVLVQDLSDAINQDSSLEVKVSIEMPEPMETVATSVVEETIVDGIVETAAISQEIEMKEASAVVVEEMQMDENVPEKEMSESNADPVSEMSIEAPLETDSKQQEDLKLKGEVLIQDEPEEIPVDVEEEKVEQSAEPEVIAKEEEPKREDEVEQEVANTDEPEEEIPHVEEVKEPIHVEAQVPAQVESQEPVHVESQESVHVESQEPVHVEAQEPAQVEAQESVHVEAAHVEYQEPQQEIISPEPEKVKLESETAHEAVDEPIVELVNEESEEAVAEPVIANEAEPIVEISEEPEVIEITEVVELIVPASAVVQSNEQHQDEITVDIDVSETAHETGTDSKQATLMRNAEESTPIRRSTRKRTSLVPVDLTESPAKRTRTNGNSENSENTENEQETEDSSTPSKPMRRSTRTRVIEK